MERVSQATVLRRWLAAEREKVGADPDGVAALSGREALDCLLDRKPGAASFVWRDAPVTWYRTTLSRPEFEALHLVEGPPGLGWRALSPDGTVLGAARHIAAGDPAALAADTGVDMAAVLAARAAGPPREPPLVLSTREGCVPRHVADGNHRAVATALDLLDGDGYEPRPAYLGVGSNRVVAPLGQRLCALLRRLWPGVAPAGTKGKRGPLQK